MNYNPLVSNENTFFWSQRRATREQQSEKTKEKNAVKSDDDDDDNDGNKNQNNTNRQFVPSAAITQDPARPFALDKQRFDLICAMRIVMAAADECDAMKQYVLR